MLYTVTEIKDPETAVPNKTNVNIKKYVWYVFTE